MPTDITTRVVEAVERGTVDGWCSRAQVDSLMSATTIDKREVDRALQRATAEGRLERSGDRYRVTES
jgi:hypothetical protein